MHFKEIFGIGASAVLVIGGIFTVNQWMDRRESVASQVQTVPPTVIVWPEQMVSTPAAPRRGAGLVGEFEILVPGCVPRPTAWDTQLIDSDRRAHLIVQRSGFRLDLPVGPYVETFSYLVPRYAAPGPGFIVFETTFRCEGFDATITQISPPYPVEVLPDTDPADESTPWPR